MGTDFLIVGVLCLMCIASLWLASTPVRYNVEDPQSEAKKKLNLRYLKVSLQLEGMQLWEQKFARETGRYEVPVDVDPAKFYRALTSRTTQEQQLAIANVERNISASRIGTFASLGLHADLEIKIAKLNEEREELMKDMLKALPVGEIEHAKSV